MVETGKHGAKVSLHIFNSERAYAPASHLGRTSAILQIHKFLITPFATPAPRLLLWLAEADSGPINVSDLNNKIKVIRARMFMATLFLAGCGCVLYWAPTT